MGRRHFDSSLAWIRHAFRGHRPVVGSRANTGHRQPPQRLAVPSTLHPCRHIVVNHKIADVGVPPEDLDRSSRTETADGLMQHPERRAGICRARRVVPDDEEEIDFLRVVGDGVEEPGFLDEVAGGGDAGDVGVAGEVEENAKGHDAQTLGGGEVAVLRADILELTRLGVQDLDVGGQVAVAVDFRERVARFVGDFCYVELVVSDCQEVVVDFLEDGVRQLAVG